MRVVHYSSCLSHTAGGLYFSVSGLVKALADRGLDVTVVGGSDEHFEQDRHVWGGVPVVPHGLELGRYGFDVAVLKSIAQMKPDLFHVHGVWSAASLYGRFAQALGIPVVTSPHGMIDPWILGRKARLKSVHGFLFERPIIEHGHVHALNMAEAKAVESFAPNAKARTFILPNGIERAVRGARGPRSGAIYIGRLHAKKQVHELARAWSQHFPTVNLTIAGWGETKYEDELKSMTANMANVDFVGPLYGEAKALALRNAKIFLLPSLSEGLPMAVLEALQSGAVPVITEDCNLSELFQGGVGFRIEADFSDFAPVVRSLLNLSDDALEVISNAAVEYSRRFEWGEIAGGMIAKYGEILATAKADKSLSYA